MKQNFFYTLLIGLILLLSIKSIDIETEPELKATDGKYTLDHILGAATRVKEYVLKHKKIPKTVGVSSDELTLAQFTYSMGIAILNIHKQKTTNQIFTLKLEAPTSTHRCNIKVELANYIDAINRVVEYCQKNRAAPAYVTSSSVQIGYAEYSFGFSKILDYYKTHKALPLYNVFDSSVFDESGSGSSGSSGEIKGISLVKGINEKTNDSDFKKYLNQFNNAIKATYALKAKAKELTLGCSTPLQKANAIFNFVKNHITYKYYENSQKGADKTLSSRLANCCDQANLIVALCRLSGIPARYSHGQHCHFYYSGNYYGHVWAQILVGNTWYAADPTGQSNSLGFIKNWDIHNYHSLKQYALIPF